MPAGKRLGFLAILRLKLYWQGSGPSPHPFTNREGLKTIGKHADDIVSRLVATEKCPWREHEGVFGVIRPGKEPVSVVCCPWLVAQMDGLWFHENSSKI